MVKKMNGNPQLFGGEDVRRISKRRQRPWVREVPENHWGQLSWDSYLWAYGTKRDYLL